MPPPPHPDLFQLRLVIGSVRFGGGFQEGKLNAQQGGVGSPVKNQRFK